MHYISAAAVSQATANSEDLSAAAHLAARCDIREPSVLHQEEACAMRLGALTWYWIFGMTASSSGHSSTMLEGSRVIS